MGPQEQEGYDREICAARRIVAEALPKYGVTPFGNKIQGPDYCGAQDLPLRDLFELAELIRPNWRATEVLTEEEP